jgi:DNA-directed RNA polymerase specialized sigma54-like protein
MSAANAELDRLQQQCNSIRAEMSGGVLAADQRLQALRNDHDRQIADIDKLRKDNQEAFAHQLEAIVTCKSTDSREREYVLTLVTFRADKGYVIARVEEMAAEVAA